MGKDDFEFIKLSDANLDEVIKYNGRFFYRAEGNIYCEDYILRITIMYDKNIDEWLECTKEIPWEIKEEYDFKKAVKDFEDNPPWPHFDEVLAHRAKENEKVMKEEIKKTPKRVIGWIDDSAIFNLHADESDEGFYAVVNDIIRHGYECTGMEFDNQWIYALLNTHEYVTLSVRGWGAAMAAAHGEYGQMDYAHYAFGFSDEVFDSEPTFPEVGMYEEVSIKNSVHVSDSLIESMDEIDYKSLESKGIESVYVLVTDPYVDKVYYDRFGSVKLISNKHKEISCMVDDIEYFDNTEQFDKYMSDFDESNIIIIREENTIKEMLKNGPIYLIRVMVY